MVRLVGRPDLGVTSGSGQHALLLPDRPANNQIDSLQNVVEQPRVGLLFFVPGMNEPLRARATAGARQAADFRSCASPGKKCSCTAAEPCSAPGFGIRRCRSIAPAFPPAGRCSRTGLRERTPTRSTHPKTRPTAISSADAAVTVPRSARGAYRSDQSEIRQGADPESL